MEIKPKRKRIKALVLFALGILSPGRPGVAQGNERDARVTVSPTVQVSEAYAKRPHAEVILAADPGDSRRLLAGSKIINAGMGSSVVAYASADGGRTWELTLEKKAEKGGRWYGNPTIAFGPDGVAYFAAMFSSGRGMEVSASRDGGRTWDAPFTAERLMDRPFLVTDCTRGRFRGRLYCSENLGGDLGVWKSRDGARTFEPPTLLVCQGSAAQSRIFGQGVVLSDGTLVVPYQALTKASDQRWSLRVQRSITGGESFLAEQIMRDYTADAGASPMMAGDFPSMANGHASGGFRDRLYLVWSERTADGTLVMLTQSNDKGATWSAAVPLGDKAGVTQEDRAITRIATMPSVAVNPAGVVAVTWYDATVRDKTILRRVRIRASTDGGVSWLPAVDVTDFVNSSDPEAGDGWLGHTAGLAADAVGAFHPLWIDSRTGVRQVFTTAVVVK